MQCDQALDALLAADLASLQRDGTARPDQPSDLMDHLDACDRCRGALSVLVAGELALSHSLGRLAPATKAEDVVAAAVMRQRRTRRRRVVALMGGSLVVCLGWLAWVQVVPEMQRMLAPPPQVVVHTFALRCMTPAEAASVIRPYLPLPQNPRWQAEMFDVSPAQGSVRAVTVRAPRSTIAAIAQVLSRVDGADAAACRGAEASR